MSYLRKVEIWRVKNREIEERRKRKKARARAAGIQGAFYNANRRAHGTVLKVAPPIEVKRPPLPAEMKPHREGKAVGVDLEAAKRGKKGRSWVSRLWARVLRFFGKGDQPLNKDWKEVRKKAREKGKR